MRGAVAACAAPWLSACAALWLAASPALGQGLAELLRAGATEPPAASLLDQQRRAWLDDAPRASGTAEPPPGQAAPAPAAPARPTPPRGPERLVFERVRVGNGVVLLVSGPFGIGDSARFAAELRAIPNLREVVFHSPGGSVVEGLEIGRMIRQRRLATRIPGGLECSSICAFAFLGGVMRSVEPAGSVCVHMFSMPPEGWMPVIERVQRAMREDRPALAVEILRQHERESAQTAAEFAHYLVEMGVSLRLLAPNFATAHRDIHCLGRREMTDLNVVNVDAQVAANPTPQAPPRTAPQAPPRTTPQRGPALTGPPSVPAPATGGGGSPVALGLGSIDGVPQLVGQDGLVTVHLLQRGLEAGGPACVVALRLSRDPEPLMLLLDVERSVQLRLVVPGGVPAGGVMVTFEGVAGNPRRFEFQRHDRLETLLVAPLRDVPDFIDAVERIFGRVDAPERPLPITVGNQPLPNAGIAGGRPARFVDQAMGRCLRMAEPRPG